MRTIVYRQRPEVCFGGVYPARGASAAAKIALCSRFGSCSMCGIVGAIAARDVSSILVDGLHRLEYRGYDSTGVAMLDSHGTLQLRRAVGKVVKPEEKLRESPCHGQQIGRASCRERVCQYV